ncbi:MAG: stage III sporulation protein AG [Candidatus Onthomonas sp.]|nr:stage III sporulation protein AG [Candidatus Onthomonas sp.]
MKLPWDMKKWGELLKRYQAVLLVLVVGLGLLLWPAGTGKEGDFAASEEQRAIMDSDAYIADLERRLETALSQMEGVGEATVVLTLESGTRRVLAYDQNGEGLETVVISAGTGQQETVTVQELAPRLQGALIICPGGGDPKVRLNILQAVEALTGLRANQISICQGTGGNAK